MCNKKLQKKELLDCWKIEKIMMRKGKIIDSFGAVGSLPEAN